MTDLNLVSLSDLAEELLNRSDHGVIITMQVGVKDGVSAYYRRSVGNSHMCIGLAHDIATRVLEENDSREVPDPAGEDEPP